MKLWIIFASGLVFGSSLWADDVKPATHAPLVSVVEAFHSTRIHNTSLVDRGDLVTGPTLSPDGRQWYTFVRGCVKGVNCAPNELWSYWQDPATEKLLSNTYQPVAVYGRSIVPGDPGMATATPPVFSPDGKMVAVKNFYNITVYDRNPTTGELTHPRLVLAQGDNINDGSGYVCLDDANGLVFLPSTDGKTRILVLNDKIKKDRTQESKPLDKPVTLVVDVDANVRRTQLNQRRSADVFLPYGSSMPGIPGAKWLPGVTPDIAPVLQNGKVIDYRMATWMNDWEGPGTGASLVVFSYNPATDQFSNAQKILGSPSIGSISGAAGDDYIVLTQGSPILNRPNPDKIFFGVLSRKQQKEYIVSIPIPNNDSVSVPHSSHP